MLMVEISRASAFVLLARQDPLANFANRDFLEPIVCLVLMIVFQMGNSFLILYIFGKSILTLNICYLFFRYSAIFEKIGHAWMVEWDPVFAT